jgi:hypothetical protein
MNTVSKCLQLGRNLPRILFNPRVLRHVVGAMFGASEDVIGPQCDLTLFPRTTLDQLIADCENDTRISLTFFPKLECSISPLESFCLAVLMRRVAVRRAFEFGTYLGVSTAQLALNVEPDGRVFTLDLPEDDPRYRLKIDDPSEKALASTPGKGKLIPKDLCSQIIFLKQDSADLDETVHREAMDFIFVDGAHSFDYVRNDSEKGWRMLRPGGMIAWHDCRPQDPDVVRYLLECSYKPTRIEGTSIAFAIKH